MSLRARLLVALVGSGCLIVAAVALSREWIVRRAAQGALRGALEAGVDAIGPSRCEQGLLPPAGRARRSPGEGPLGPRSLGWRGGGRGPGGPPGSRRAIQIFFFGRDFNPRLEDSPPFPPPARQALAGGASFALVPARDGPAGGAVGVLATGWAAEGCAYAMAFLPAPPSPLPLAFLVGASLLFLGALAGALYVAAASPVRRIRALSAEVRSAASRRYAAGVAVQGRDEVAGLAAAFNEASAAVRSQLVEVERRERALRDFVANTTHDVALPLSVLAGQLSEMRERLEAGAAVEADLVAAATRETQYLGSLLHNLGAVSHLEAQDSLGERHPVELRGLVERVVLRHAGPARDQAVELNHAVPPEPVTVAADVTLLEQALNNLVLNAIAYNRPGGHVGVVLDAQGSRFELSVVDDGPGVASEELKRLGEPRFRGGEARSRRPAGRGLGLSIARDVALRHGFTLEFRLPEAGGFEARLEGATQAADAPR